MAVLAWTMMGLALWHFTIFIDDKFWGGIVGAFVGAVVGSVLLAIVISGFQIPSRTETDVLVTLYAIPGALLGMALVYFEGARRERANPR